MEKYDLKCTHAIYLTVLLRHPDGITATELAEHCGRDKGEASRMIALLIKKGLIRKEEKSSGVYRSRMYLTEQGQAIAGEITLKAEAAVERANCNIDAHEREVFYRVLEGISLNLLAMCENELENETNKTNK